MMTWVPITVTMQADPSAMAMVMVTDDDRRDPDVIFDPGMKMLRKLAPGESHPSHRPTPEDCE